MFKGLIEFFVLVLFILFIITSPSRATEGAFINYLVNAGKGNIADSKAITLGQTFDKSHLKLKYEVGAYFDHRKGATSSGLGMVGVGVRPTAGQFYISFYQKVGLITHIDQWLGYPFPQFGEELSIGLLSKDGAISIGFVYNHISNGGIDSLWGKGSPNRGRDFMGLQIGFPILW